MGRSKLRIGLTQQGSDEGGSTGRTSKQIEDYHRRKRTFQYKKNDRGKVIKIPMLTGGQAKLDKNKNNRLDAQDFKILRAEKAKGRGKGLQDEKVKPGKVMKAKTGSGLDLPVIKSVKPEAKKNTTKTNPNKKRFSSMEEMRKAKGFRPGETPAEFNKRKAMLKRSVEAAKATRIGKIVAPIALAGVGAVQYLKSKMKKEESMRDRKKQPLKMKDKMEKKMGGGMMRKYSVGGPASEARQRKKNLEERVQKAAVSNIFSNFRQGAKKAEKKYASIPSGMKKDRDTDTKIKLNLLKSSRKDPFKEMDDTRREVFATERMGGGMMKRPMGYKAGMSIKGDDKREIRKTEQMIGASKSSPREKARKKMMGGGMMQRPMGYRSGKSVKVKCKLGRNKPTKMY